MPQRNESGKVVKSMTERCEGSSKQNACRWRAVRWALRERFLTTAALMLEPGATMSTQGPLFEKLDLLSILSLEPTVIAAGTNAGEKLQAFEFEFPVSGASGEK